MLTATYNEQDCLTAFEKRRIRYAFHDIDGTHSLIRNWPPVMSIVLYDVIVHGLPADFDSLENEHRLIAEAGQKPLPETDTFCVDSAGLSALTQMEWAIRRAVEEGTVAVPCDHTVNSEKVRLIHAGRERFPDMPDTPEMDAMLKVYTPRLFKLYERVLNGFCRDKNLEEAKTDPEKYRVKGSFEFLRFLKDNGVKNYFVTGAVVEKGMGMHEEVVTLGYRTGEGELVDDIIGSTWDEKLPKDEIMRALMKKLGAKGEEILITGDGRSEVSAGAGMGAFIISRLPESAEKQRKLHRELGTHIIVADYFEPALYRVLKGEKEN